MSPEVFPKGFHVRKTIAFALVLTLLLPIAVFWGWLVLSPKPPLLDGVLFSPLVLDRDGNLLRLGLSEDEKYRVRIRLNEVAPEMVRAVLLYEDRCQSVVPAQGFGGDARRGTAYGRFHDYHAGGPAPARPVHNHAFGQVCADGPRPSI